MRIGVPKEIKNHEYRIGLTPAGSRELAAHGHKVIVQRDGGKSIGLTNEMYEKAGAKIVAIQDHTGTVVNPNGTNPAARNRTNRSLSVA